MFDEIVNDKILSDYGEDMSLVYDLDFVYNETWLEIEEEISKIY